MEQKRFEYIQEVKNNMVAGMLDYLKESGLSAPDALSVMSLAAKDLIIVMCHSVDGMPKEEFLKEYFDFVTESFKDSKGDVEGGMTMYAVMQELQRQMQG